MAPNTPMAVVSMYNSFLFLLPFLLLLPSTSATVTPTSSTPHHGVKSLHFALYQHETVNKTGYLIVNGVAGPGVTQTTTPFGTIFVFNDPMTTTPDPASRTLGFAEGTSLTSSFDGLRSVSIAKITLNVKGHKGSVSVVGGTHNLKPADHPVVGGTGDFLFVQGYVTSSPVELKGLTVIYKIQFHLYWPPYVTKVST